MRTKIIIAGLLLVLGAAAAYWYSQGSVKLSETDAILIGGFSNATGDSVFDGALREALAISLTQSPMLNAFRCVTDDALASANGDAASRGAVLHTLGLLAADLRRRLGEDPASVQRFDLPLERATTASLDALKAFTEGRRLTREQGAIDAVPALKKAVDLDPRFALAYYNLNQNALAADRIRQAFELADRQTVRDRLHITTLYYDLGTGDVNKAIDSYKEWVRLYPRDDIAKGNLSSEYFVIGDYEQAALLGQQALRLDPGSAAWYENLSTAYIALLRLDDAQAVLNQAFAHKLDDASMHAGLYALAFLRGDSPGMAREMIWSAGKPGGEDAMLALQADTEAYFGHLKKARDLSLRAVQAAQRAQLTEPAAIWQGTAAIREAIYGNLEEAQNGAEKALEIAPKSRDTQILAILALTRAGEGRRAQTLMDDLAAGHSTNTIVQSAWLPSIRAQAELRGQRAAKALELLEVARRYERGQLIGNLTYSCMTPVYLRGEAYLSARQGPQAHAEFQKLLDNRGVVGNCWSGALASLGQARARVLEGNVNSARIFYNKFFSLWKDADPDIPIFKSARAEFAKLKSKSN